MHPTQPTHHGEVDVDFKMFGLRVSFKWQPVINNNTLRAMQKWALSDKTEQPTFILLGKFDISSIVTVFSKRDLLIVNSYLSKKQILLLRIIDLVNGSRVKPVCFTRKSYGN